MFFLKGKYIFCCDMYTKSLLEEMRIASKSKKNEPILTTEEIASQKNKAEIKGTGF